MLRYFEGGSGTPLIVLVHGLTGAASNWFELATMLAPSHRVLIPDLPGHSGSSPASSGATVADFAEDVLAVAAGSEPAVFVGHSLGGLICLRAAERAPERVAGVVLIAAAGISTSRRVIQVLALMSAWLQPGRMMARLWSRTGDNRLIRRVMLNALFVAEPKACSAEAFKGLMLGHFDHEDVVTAARAMAREDPEAAASNVSCPAVVVWGEKDRQVPAADGAEYARRLSAPLEVLPNSGHLVMLERPEVVTTLIHTFAASVGTSSPD